VWALVWGHLVRAIVLNVSMSVFAGWMPGFAIDFRGLGDLLRFGVGIAGTHIVGTTGTTVNTFLLARVLGSTGVGLFAMGQSLTEAPSRLSSAIINQVSLPLFSRVQHDRALLSASFLRISKYLAAISLPVQIGLALVAPDLVPALLSPKWSAIVVPFQILCLESAVVLATLACSPLLTARGRAKLLFSRSFLSLATLVGATIVGSPFGLVGVVIARAVVMIPLRLTLLLPTLFELGVSLSVYLRTLGSPLAATALMSAGVLAAQFARPAEAGHFEMLAATVSLGAAIYLVALFLLDRSLTTDIRTMARDLFSPSSA
jgi:O-antigen/teichoic acid export membrane protein